MIIENPTLAHFRHFRHFSSLFTLSPLYICREPSTNQLLFMQNKPNFRKAKMNIYPYNTMNYKYFIPLAGYKNKANSNPIKPSPERSRMGQFLQSPKSLAGKSGPPQPPALDLTKDKWYRVIVNMTHSSIRKGVKTNASAIKSS